MSASTTYDTADDIHEDSIFRTSAHALSDAAVDARASAKAAAQNVKDGVGWGVYKAAFGVSFGVVFTGVFLTELLPQQSSVRRGLEDGAEAALDAIEARKLPVDEPLGATADEHLHHETVQKPRAARASTAKVASRPPRKRTRAARA